MATCPDCGESMDPRAQHCRRCYRPHLPRHHAQFQPGMTPHNKRTAQEVVSQALAQAEPWGDCLLASPRQPSGYVRRWVSGKQVTLHRAVMEVALGRPLLSPDRETVDHLCHNEDTSCPGGPTCPHRGCIRPEHLAVRPIGENWAGGRQGAPAMRRNKTHCPYGHPYSGDNLIITTDGGRGCLACKRALRAGRDRATEPAGRLQTRRRDSGQPI